LPGKGENVLKIQEALFGILNSLAGESDEDDEKK
jgi:hypothetical protein